jgi:Sec-independent protein translocase protein TatA
METVVVLVIVLVLVLVWRGPKTLPKLGRAFGQGVKEAREEIDGIKRDSTHKDAEAPVPPPPPQQPPPPPA